MDMGRRRTRKHRAAWRPQKDNTARKPQDAEDKDNLKDETRSSGVLPGLNKEHPREDSQSSYSNCSSSCDLSSDMSGTDGLILEPTKLLGNDSNIRGNVENSSVPSMEGNLSGLNMNEVLYSSHAEKYGEELNFETINVVEDIPDDETRFDWALEMQLSITSEPECLESLFTGHQVSQDNTQSFQSLENSNLDMPATELEETLILKDDSFSTLNLSDHSPRLDEHQTSPTVIKIRDTLSSVKNHNSAEKAPFVQEILTETSGKRETATEIVIEYLTSKNIPEFDGPDLPESLELSVEDPTNEVSSKSSDQNLPEISKELPTDKFPEVTVEAILADVPGTDGLLQEQTKLFGNDSNIRGNVENGPVPQIEGNLSGLNIEVFSSSHAGKFGEELNIEISNVDDIPDDETKVHCALEMQLSITSETGYQSCGESPYEDQPVSQDFQSPEICNLEKPATEHEETLTGNEESYSTLNLSEHSPGLDKNKTSSAVIKTNDTLSQVRNDNSAEKASVLEEILTETSEKLETATEIVFEFSASQDLPEYDRPVLPESRELSVEDPTNEISRKTPEQNLPDVSEALSTDHILAETEELIASREGVTFAHSSEQLTTKLYKDNLAESYECLILKSSQEDTLKYLLSDKFLEPTHINLNATEQVTAEEPPQNIAVESFDSSVISEDKMSNKSAENYTKTDETVMELTQNLPLESMKKSDSESEQLWEIQEIQQVSVGMPMSELPEQILPALAKTETLLCGESPSKQNKLSASDELQYVQETNPRTEIQSELLSKCANFPQKVDFERSYLDWKNKKSLTVSYLNSLYIGVTQMDSIFIQYKMQCMRRSLRGKLKKENPSWLDRIRGAGTSIVFTTTWAVLSMVHAVLTKMVRHQLLFIMSSDLWENERLRENCALPLKTNSLLQEKLKEMSSSSLYGTIAIIFDIAGITELMKTVKGSDQNKRIVLDRFINGLCDLLEMLPGSDAYAEISKAVRHYLDNNIPMVETYLATSKSLYGAYDLCKNHIWDVLTDSNTNVKTKAIDLLLIEQDCGYLFQLHCQIKDGKTQSKVAQQIKEALSAIQSVKDEILDMFEQL